MEMVKIAERRRNNLMYPDRSQKHTAGCVCENDCKILFCNYLSFPPLVLPDLVLLTCLRQDKRSSAFLAVGGLIDEIQLNTQLTFGVGAAKQVIMFC
jgi:hypothetical protein